MATAPTEHRIKNHIDEIVFLVLNADDSPLRALHGSILLENKKMREENHPQKTDSEKIYL